MIKGTTKSRLCSSTSSERTATVPDKSMHNVYDDVIRCEAPPPNLNFPKMFYTWFGDKLPNLRTANISG